ncbi:MAG: hypothetical protein HYY07_05070, partial [Elusimicrobia bacterium]|nr:hypothetical protein [Elusimicrobiota bacterium]
MIEFWTEIKNRSWLQWTGMSVAVSFLFVTLSAPFAQASFWEERRKSVQEIQNKQKDPFQLASLVESNSYQSVIGNGMMVPQGIHPSLLPSPNSQISSEMMQRVMSRVKTKRSRSHKIDGLPYDLASKIERFGEIERVHLTPGMNGTPSVIPAKAGIQSPPSVLDSRFRGNDGAGVPLILHIQDAHGILQAQKS